VSGQNLCGFASRHGRFCSHFCGLPRKPGIYCFRPGGFILLYVECVPRAAVNQFPRRMPGFFTPLTPRMPLIFLGTASRLIPASCSFATSTGVPLLRDRLLNDSDTAGGPASRSHQRSSRARLLARSRFARQALQAKSCKCRARRSCLLGPGLTFRGRGRYAAYAYSGGCR
jgi:hypothetical protein